AVGDDDAAAGLLESRPADFAEERIEDNHLDAAAEKLAARFSKHRVERVLRAECLLGERKEPADADRRRGLRGCGCRGGRDERRENEGPHRAIPSPRSTARASISPKPNELSRPGAPRSIAYCSIRASIAAGDLTPCCIIIAATPATCGADIDVPM